MNTWSHTPIVTQFRTIDGLSIRFARSEDRDDHALLLSPWPESLLAFEPIWARLAEHTHLVALDLPCGAPNLGYGRRAAALGGAFVLADQPSEDQSAPDPLTDRTSRAG